MIIALLVISLLLHGVTVLWIIILMQRQEQPATFKREMEQVKSEIEDMLVSYTAEMKENNNHLLKQLQIQRKYDKDKEDQKEIIPFDPPKKINSTPKSNPVHQNNQIEQESERYKEYIPPSINENEDERYEKSIQAEVLMLNKLGHTAEQIAKKLNIGTGEVELMINFYKKD